MRACVRMRVRVRACVCKCACVRAYASVHACVRMRVCVCECAYASVRMRVCVCGCPCAFDMLQFWNLKTTICVGRVWCGLRAFVYGGVIVFLLFLLCIYLLHIYTYLSQSPERCGPGVPLCISLSFFLCIYTYVSQSFISWKVVGGIQKLTTVCGWDYM